MDLYIFPRVFISAWLAYSEREISIYLMYFLDVSTVEQFRLILQTTDENIEYLLQSLQPDILCAPSVLNTSWTAFCELPIMLHRKRFY